MQYSTRPPFGRRYPHSNTVPSQKGDPLDTYAKNPGHNEMTINIPLPNELEEKPEHPSSIHNRHKSSFLEYLKKRITLEEVILLGLIFLLLDDAIEDEFLLIMLIYILLF